MLWISNIIVLNGCVNTKLVVCPVDGVGTHGVSFVDVALEGVLQVSCIECHVEESDGGVLSQHIREHGVLGTNHTAHGVNHPILYRVVHLNHASLLIYIYSQLDFTRNGNCIRVASDGERTLQHIHRWVSTIVEVGGEESLLNDVREGDGVAILLAQLVNGSESTTLQILLNCLIGWSENGVRTVSSEQVHHL